MSYRSGILIALVAGFVVGLTLRFAPVATQVWTQASCGFGEGKPEHNIVITKGGHPVDMRYVPLVRCAVPLP